jgi:hypothetical protein
MEVATMTQARLAWAIAVLDVVVFLAMSLHPSDGGYLAILLYVVGIASFAGVGALLITRVPANPIGVLLLVSATVLVAAIAIGTYADVGGALVSPWPAIQVARLLGNSLFIYAVAIAFIGVPLVFPDGRLPSRRFRWVVRLAVADLVAWTVLGLQPEAGIGGPDALAWVWSALLAFVVVATLICLVGAVLAIGLRFGRGDPVQRQQVKWLIADVAVAAVLLPLAVALNPASPELAGTLSGFAIIAMFALPIVIGVAILRYRLYEIDRIVSRTIGWAASTAMVVGLFGAGLVALETLLAGVTQGSTLAVAGSTLAAFAAFQPIRRHVQSFVDRRFDRARYDAARIAGAFAARLRGQLELGAVEAELVATTASALRPAGAGLWLRDRTSQPRRRSAVAP